MFVDGDRVVQMPAICMSALSSIHSCQVGLRGHSLVSTCSTYKNPHFIHMKGKRYY